MYCRGGPAGFHHSATAGPDPFMFYTCHVPLNHLCSRFTGGCPSQREYPLARDTVPQRPAHGQAGNPHVPHPHAQRADVLPVLPVYPAAQRARTRR